MANRLTGRERTAAAVAANRRRRQDRIAAELRDAGWHVLPPELIERRGCEPAAGRVRRVEFTAPELPGQLTLT